MADSERVEELQQLITKYLDELGLKYLRDQDGVVPGAWDTGVRVHLAPKDFGPDMSVVQIIAPTNLGLQGPRRSVAMFVATENSKFLFGRLALYPEQGAVGFEESLLGTFLNRAELEVAIGVVSTMADKYDDEIQQRFGGEKAGRGF